MGIQNSCFRKRLIKDKSVKRFIFTRYNPQNKNKTKILLLCIAIELKITNVCRILKAILAKVI